MNTSTQRNINMKNASTSTSSGVGSFTVPVKHHDGDGDGSSKHKHVVGETQQDAFSRYSNDLLRMKAILLFTEDEDQDQADEDLDSLATINRALSSVGLSNLHLNQGNADVSKRRKETTHVLCSKVINARRGYLGKHIRVCYYTT
ncbi:hypothetical protein QTG54_007733 [Skeletonema marinoi]|uniref:Uncharacterized protein n=1 Tax=Skeletonema marinoi TaxID=267567 RepID=A0AAD9DD14_9STRA|nr:hypothetical protein QTG54_007733 [Skeletonema marinoi]